MAHAAGHTAASTSMTPGGKDALDDALAAIEAARHGVEEDFPGWRVWLSNLDRWWAVRTGPDARYGPDDLRPMTIDADHAVGLRAQLAHYAATEPEP